MTVSGAAEPHEERRSPFKINWKIDSPTLATSAALMIIPPLINNELTGPVCDPCDKSDLNALDKTVVGNYSPMSGKISDWMLFSAPGLGLGLFLVDAWSFGWRSYLEDMVILCEAVLIQGAFQQLAALAIRRPRPYMYLAKDELPDARESEERGHPKTAQSFFSGHTSTVFAVATTFAYVYTKRRPDMRHKWLVWTAAMALATPVPLMRVAAGEHFWTDVLLGAVVGISSGLILPALHERELGESGVKVSLFGAAGSVGLRGTF
jgi:membrane-associated phospholipid phosphatase